MYGSMDMYMNPNMIEKHQGNRYYYHYARYLSSLAFQLFEWEGLPKSVDPRYLEMMLHTHGYVGFYNEPTIGYIAVQGAVSGVNHYLLPTKFRTATPQLENRDFEIFNNGTKANAETQGVVIYNNDMHLPSMNSIMMFAQDLAELKEIIRINQNAQKTPVMIVAEDTNQFSLKQVYNQYEGNAPVIVVNKNFDPEAIKVFKTDAPFVVDKLNLQKNAVWLEAMTYFGIKNANMDKKERMVSDEVESNNEQIEASGNIMLKSREEACERINELFGLNISVKVRHEIEEEFYSQLEKGEQDGSL